MQPLSAADTDSELLASILDSAVTSTASLQLPDSTAAQTATLFVPTFANLSNKTGKHT